MNAVVSRLFFLSFADGTRPSENQFLGAAFVYAASQIDAVREAHRLGCNPGGEVLMADVAAGVDVPPRLVGRLLSREEVEEWDAHETARRRN